jgi:hypothetical protein
VLSDHVPVNRLVILNPHSLQVKDLNFRIPGLNATCTYPPPVFISGDVNTGFTSFCFDQSWYV